MKKRLALGPRVAVDQHRLRAALARLSAIDAVLAAVAKARVIGPRPVDLRRLAVVLLEARAHLALKLLLQGQRRREQRVGIGVFGLQERANVARQLRSDRAGPRASCQRGSRHSRRPRRSRGRRAALAGPRRGAAPGLRLVRLFRRSVAIPRQSWSARSPKGSPRGSAKKAAGTSDGEAHKAAAPASRSSPAPP